MKRRPLTSEFPGIYVVILNTIRRPSHLSAFETWDTPDDILLYVLRHTIRNAVRIDEI
jgi:hypothetical protein